MSKIQFTRHCWLAARVGMFASFAALMICAAPGVAWGAGKKQLAGEPPPPKGYTMMYMATIIVIAGGVAIVCLPSRRKKDVE